MPNLTLNGSGPMFGNSMEKTYSCLLTQKNKTKTTYYWSCLSSKDGYFTTSNKHNDIVTVIPYLRCKHTAHCKWAYHHLLHWLGADYYFWWQIITAVLFIWCYSSFSISNYIAYWSVHLILAEKIYFFDHFFLFNRKQILRDVTSLRIDFNSECSSLSNNSPLK